MSRSWPAVLLFGVLLFVRGCGQAEQGTRRLAEHPPRVVAGDGDLAGRSENLAHAGDRRKAQTEIDAGRYLQVGGGLVAVAGVVLLGLRVVCQQGQRPASQPEARPTGPAAAPTGRDRPAGPHPPAAPAAPPAPTPAALTPPAGPNERLARMKLIVEVLTGVVGLAGAVLALFGLSHQ